jgi:hypothetical protein
MTLVASPAAPPVKVIILLLSEWKEKSLCNPLSASPRISASRYVNQVRARNLFCGTLISLFGTPTKLGTCWRTYACPTHISIFKRVSIRVGHMSTVSQVIEGTKTKKSVWDQYSLCLNPKFPLFLCPLIWRLCTRSAKRKDLWNPIRWDLARLPERASLISTFEKCHVVSAHIYSSSSSSP